MTCHLSGQIERFEDYLLGRLPEDDQARLELHFFECDECLRVLETLRDVRIGLSAPSFAASSTRTEPRWQPLAMAAGLGAVVIAGGLLLWMAGARPDTARATDPSLAAEASRDVPSTPARVEAPPPAAPAQVAAAEATAGEAGALVAPRQRSLGQLAQFAPPPYLALTLRGGGEAAASDEGFALGMQRYMARDYEGARQALARAVAADPGRPAAHFYLGICLLLQGEAEEAATAFSRTVGLGDSIYYEDAHFFLAKARLRQGRVDEARTALDTVATMAGEREREARDLLRELPVR